MGRDGEGGGQGGGQGGMEVQENRGGERAGGGREGRGAGAAGKGGFEENSKDALEDAREDVPRLGKQERCSGKRSALGEHIEDTREDAPRLGKT